MRDHLLEDDRVKAIQEEMAEFFLEQVIDPNGEYFYPLEFMWMHMYMVEFDDIFFFPRAFHL